MQFALQGAMDLQKGPSRHGGRKELSSCPSLAPTVLLAVAVVLGLLLTPRVQAQGSQQAPSFLGRTLSGNVGFAAEAYGVSGIASRRPPGSFRIFANTSFDLYGLQSGFDVTYSTEGSGLRQSMNRISFNAEWGWGRASAGTVSPTLSNYSLNGETLRGGLLEISPGPFTATFTAGRTQRAIQPHSQGLSTISDSLSRRDSRLRGPAYERWLYAARVGVGRESGTHFHLVGVLGRDDEASLDIDPPLRTDEGGGSTNGSGARDLNDPVVRPAENLSVTPSFGLGLFDGTFRLNAEATASAFTRDTRSERVDLSGAGVPGFLTDVFSPRSSSRVTVAGEAAAELSLRRFGLRVGYDRVQPGFRSMGRPQERGDREVISVRSQVALFQSRLNLTGQVERTRNNLLNQKISTLSRTQFSLNAQARLSQAFSVSGAVMQMLSDNAPVTSLDREGASKRERLLAQALMRRNLVRTISLTPVLLLRSGQTAHTFTLSTSLQTLTNERPMLAETATPRPDVGTQSVNATLNYAFSGPSGVSMNVSANASTNAAATTDTQVMGINAGAGYAFFDRWLRTNASLGVSQTTNTLQPVEGAVEMGSEHASRQLNATLSASCDVWEQGSLSLNVRGLSSQSARSASFQEVQTSLRFTHQF